MALLECELDADVDLQILPGVAVGEGLDRRLGAQCVQRCWASAYEPMVKVEDGQPHQTSRTAELRAGRLAAARYHRACYVLTHDDLQAP